MPSISVPAALAIGGGLTAAGSVASGVIGSSAAKSAAQTQANAADLAAANQLSMFNTVQGNLAPFTAAGTSAVGQLQQLTGSGPGGNPLTAPLTTPFQPTMAQLAQTPGYQFTLQQGTQAAQNVYAGQGLARSGPALKGAVNYAEGLAGTTYQNQFQNYLAQNQQIYNMLGGLTTTGENAAATTGSLGVQSQTTANQLSTSGAAASAAGTIGSANAVTNALTGIGGAGTNTALLLALNNNGLFGAGSGSGSGTGGLT